MNKESKHKAIALFSGGLDSILAVKWMQRLGFTVYPVFFATPYLPPERAIESAAMNGIKLIVRDISAEHLQILETPVYGFGKYMNPCIDCHGLMFRLAGEMLAELGADFLISGEVLGQRPMSQRRDAMNQVGKLSGYKDLLVRPLSQMLLDDTLPIREAWVDKEALLDISGRGRTRQLALAKELGIDFFPSPAGGCLLTDASYSLRMKDLQKHNQLDNENLHLLRYGRHFRLNPTCKLIIGRDREDNANIESQGKRGIYLDARDITGPVGYITCCEPDEESYSLALSIFWFYHRKAPDQGYLVIRTGDKRSESFVNKCDETTVNKYYITT